MILRTALWEGAILTGAGAACGYAVAVWGTLAAEMLQTFKALGIHREALAALRVFCEAARREEATVELARRTAEIIEKVQREAPPKRGRGGKA